MLSTAVMALFPIFMMDFAPLVYLSLVILEGLLRSRVSAFLLLGILKVCYSPLGQLLMYFTFLLVASSSNLDPYLTKFSLMKSLIILLAEKSKKVPMN